MKFAGWQRVSFVDYPKHIVTTVFVAKCNYNCVYCHNKSIFRSSSLLTSNEVVQYLWRNQGMLDGLCISGGEPSLHSVGVVDFLTSLRSLFKEEMKLKVDTNGSSPDFVKSLRGLADMVAIDFKTRDYSLVGGDVKSVVDSLSILHSMKSYEVRMTLYPPFFSRSVVAWMAGVLSELGIPRAVFQRCRKVGGGYYDIDEEEIQEYCKLFSARGVEIDLSRYGEVL